MRQAGHFFLNGQPIGKYENGVTAVGLDITKFVKFGGQDNLLAVKVDNSPNYKEEATGTPFEWNAKDFNPNFGGLNRDAKLIVTGKIYQTLPLYENLQTTGVYVYPEAIDVKKKTAEVKVEAEVVNETGDYASITLSAVVVDADGSCARSWTATPPTWWPARRSLHRLRLAGRRPLLGCERPVSLQRLFHPHRERQGGGRVRDADRLSQDGVQGRRGHGRRLAERPFCLADRLLAALGRRLAGPRRSLSRLDARLHHAALAREQWQLHALDARLAQRADVSACDRYGIVEVCPAGDKERLVTGRQWDQRVEVMRDSMIFYRNNPSIFFWEAGNTIVTPAR
jgi:beta-galactosidase